MVVTAGIAAFLAVQVPVRPGDDPVWYLYSGDAEDAPQFLSNLVTAMITMATLVISITMVVLTLAAQQLGPRLIRNFMADRRTQITLGLFVATVVYLLLVLRSTSGATDSVPNLAVTGGTALVLLCLGAVLFFVHHLARSIIADTTIDRVGSELDRDLVRLLPESERHPVALPLIRPCENGAPLTLRGSGYVQSVNHAGLVEIAKKADAVIELGIKPGRHVILGGTFGWIHPPEAATEERRSKIEGCLTLEGERASIQDPENSIRQLVEVALRALSPSVNDPFTAMAVVDRLTESLAKVMRRGSPPSIWEDENGLVRVLAPRSTFADFLEEAFRQIRQHSQENPAVLIRLVENLGQLLAQAEAAQNSVLQKQIEIVLDIGRRSIPQKDDLEALENRAIIALGKTKTPMS
jgi:uncharacterized membrane protein